MNNIRVIALYLPQFHPTPENDKWWGKGFTEWTNVGKAKPLFKGHYQPRVPADLGYYDLRLPESRQAQADLAKAFGIEGFCYWHYWFGNGRMLLDRPFHEVLVSGEPDFPFCLAWANHSWEDKQFSKEGTHRVLMEQLYPGDEDYIQHFNYLLKAFKDNRYVRVEGKPFFMVYNPKEIPNVSHFIDLWQSLAVAQGFKIYFVAHTYSKEDIELFKSWEFDAVVLGRLFDVFKRRFSIFERIYTKIQRVIFKKGKILDYGLASCYFSGEEDLREDCLPVLIPNWDHSPRSGRKGHILINSTPEKFKRHVKEVFNLVSNKQNKIVILKSWNEWAEGNYIEPDLKYGKAYLEVLKDLLAKYSR